MADARVIGASTDSARIGLNMASNLGTFICLPFSQLSLPKICQETTRRANVLTLSVSRAREYSSGRSVSYTRSRASSAFLNLLLQRQHLGVARYVAMARTLRLFAGASCSRSLGDCIEPNTDKLKLALTALDKRAFMN